MTAMTHEPTPTPEQILLEEFLALETPKGFKAELIEGELVVSPTPDGDHQDAIDLIVAQVYRHSQVPMQQSGNTGLILPRGGLCPKNHAIPDITFAPRDLRLFRGAPPWMPCDGVTMVAEVTSSRPQGDRIAKRHCYARGGIPLYLLVDRQEGMVTLFSEPASEDYTEKHPAPFGKTIALPEPFAFELDTADFV
ncbi:Uma2 family endonuclease [Streptomyces sp. P1-3]|uniref:Uma2 family endonuclease n=1 Tax=Streptomyces sp. P1-3 TaxID=3421658 RepID=UPI003D361D25